jgi:spore coat polysaccharide biosynthesis protein SpsF
VEDGQSNDDLRWTVDTPEDLALVRRIYDELDLATRVVSYRAILAHVRAHPDFAAMNRDVVQKAT